MIFSWWPRYCVRLLSSLATPTDPWDSTISEAMTFSLLISVWEKPSEGELFIEFRDGVCFGRIFSHYRISWVSNTLGPGNTNKSNRQIQTGMTQREPAQQTLHIDTYVRSCRYTSWPELKARYVLRWRIEWLTSRRRVHRGDKTAKSFIFSVALTINSVADNR